MYQTFIGIDMGKANFYAMAYGGKKAKEYENTPKGFAAFDKDFNAVLTDALVIVEATGGYELAFIGHLQTQHVAVHRANARKVKHFIRSYGKLGKSDALDADALAHYGHERVDILTPYEGKIDPTLFALVNRRDRLVKFMAQEKNRASAPGLLPAIQTSIKETRTALQTQLDKINQAISDHMQASECLQVKEYIMRSVSGIGPVVAMTLLAGLPELGTLSRREIAALAGVAPHPNESGNRVGYRFVRGGRQFLKPTLYVAAMAVSRSKGDLGKFYRRKVAEGKKKKVVLGALMRKIITIVNARMKQYYDGVDIDLILKGGKPSSISLG